MNGNRRAHSAAGLRVFFDQQISHLQKLFTVLNHPMHESRHIDKQDRLIVEDFVEAANNRMRAVQGYSHKLRQTVQALHRHVDTIAEQIPPPVNLNRQAIKSEPLINALFVNNHDIGNLINNNPDVRAYLQTRGNEAMSFFAFLTASKCEKHTLGIALQGQMLVRDVPQKAVDFSDHKIHAPCASGLELNVALKRYLFTRLEELVKDELAMFGAAQASKSGQDFYESHVNSMANPDVYLHTLVKYLEAPARLLRVEKIHLKLSKMGVKLNNDDDLQSINDFDVYELVWGDSTRNVIVKVVYSN